MSDAALLDSLHAALRNPDLAWYAVYCTQGLADMIAGGSLASIREGARTIFKDRSLTDDYLFANSIWPEPELLGLVDDLTGRTGRNL